MHVIKLNFVMFSDAMTSHLKGIFPGNISHSAAGCRKKIRKLGIFLFKFIQLSESISTRRLGGVLYDMQYIQVWLLLIKPLPYGTFDD